MYRNLVAATLATMLIAPGAMARPAPTRGPSLIPAASMVSMILIVRSEPRYCIREVATGSQVARNYCKSRADWIRAGLDPIARY